MVQSLVNPLSDFVPASASVPASEQPATAAGLPQQRLTLAWRWGGLALTALMMLITLYWLWPKSNDLVLSGLVQAKEVRNASQMGGRVSELLVQEGDSVIANQALVRFDETELKTRLLEAQATLRQAQGEADLVLSGPDRQDIKQSEALVQQARQRLHLLTRGARPEEVAQAKAALEEARLQSQSAKERYDRAKTTFENGIISKFKVDELKLQLDSAKNTLQAAEAKLQLLQAGAAREEKSIARSELLSVEAQRQKLLSGAKPGQLKIVSAQVQRAQSAVTGLQNQLKEAVLRAPLAGTVSLITVSQGELVPPGQPVVTILDYQHLWADLFVPESRLAYVQPGQAVEVHSPAYGKAKFKGQVIFISPKSEFVPNGSGTGSGGAASNPTESLFKVKISLTPQDSKQQVHLAPGMKVDVVLKQQAMAALN